MEKIFNFVKLSNDEFRLEIQINGVQDAIVIPRIKFDIPTIKESTYMCGGFNGSTSAVGGIIWKDVKHIELNYECVADIDSVICIEKHMNK